MARDLKLMYSAATADEAEFQWEVFAEKWDKQYPAKSPVLARPLGTRHSTVCLSRDDPARDRHHQCIESVNSTLRKVTQAQRIFPSDEAVSKVLYLAMQTVTKHWTVSISNWKAALNWFSLTFSERIPQ